MKKRIYIVLLLSLLAGMSVAAPHYGTGALTHWLGFSVMGVEATPIMGKTEAKAGVGGGGQVSLFYELHKGHFFFNAGVGADYLITNCSLSRYSDEFPRVDPYTGQNTIYRYIYSDYREQQTQMRMVVPVQFGYRFGSWVYIGLGAAYRTQPFINSTSSKARMLTEGEYENYIQPIRNTEAYEYWPEAEYKNGGKVRSATHEVAVEAELGARIPIVRGVQMRIGAYVGYDIPIDKFANRAAMPLVSYTPSDTRAIRFNSLFDSALLNKDVQRIRAGVRVTFLFNVTRNRQACMCMTD